MITNVELGQRQHCLERMNKYPLIMHAILFGNFLVQSLEFVT